MMKKNNINRIFLTVLISVMLLFGCSKDFLDTKQLGVKSGNDFYKTDADATAAVMACYNYFKSMNGSIWTSLWMTKMSLSDEIFTGGENSGDRPEYQELNTFSFGPTNSPISNTYSYAYRVILRANQIIDNFGPEPTEYQKLVIAESKVIRSYMYLELASLYGTPPLVLHELKPSEYAQPNSSQEDIYNQIILDCTEAAAVLPAKSQMAAAGMDISRMSKGAALAFKGKAELYAKKYSDAVTTFEQLISSGEYGLYQLSELRNNDYTEIFRKSTEFGKESIFEISYASDRGNEWGNAFGDLWVDPSRTNPSNTVWQLCGPRGDQGFVGGSTGIIGGWGFGYPTYSIHTAFKNAGDSIRIKANIMTEAQLKEKGGKLKQVVDGKETNYPWGCPGMIRVKYTTWADETAGPVLELNYGTNYRIIRYADVLLMAAEANLQAGNAGKAREYLSLVRSRVNLTTPGTITMDNIKLERRLELSFEGVRYQDLTRWGDAENELKDQGKSKPTGRLKADGSMIFDTNPAAGFKPKNYLFPIPFNEISSNTQIKQNPGY